MLKLEKLDYVKHPIPVQEVYFTPRIEAKTQVDKLDLVKPKKLYIIWQGHRRISEYDFQVFAYKTKKYMQITLEYLHIKC